MRHAAALLFLTATAVAQTYAYSPGSAATTDVNSENTIPWRYTSGRYLQTHGDLTGSPRTFSELACRRYGWLGAQTGATARTLDMELYCLHANAGRPSTTFTANYATTPVLVITRKSVNLPDLTANLGNPAPWNIVFPFDQSFSYSGSQPFGWELRIHGSTATGAYFTDSYESDTNNGRVTRTGTGCIATGRTAPMMFFPTVQTSRPQNSFEFYWSFSNGPAFAPSSFLMGTGPLDLPVPGLCSNLYVSGVFVTLSASTNASGTAIAPAISVPYNPAFVGMNLHGQGASADAGQTGLPVAVTDGARVTIEPLPGPALPIYRLYTGSVTGTTGVTDPSKNYGQAVRVKS
jgi:hypothetical protein